MSECQGFKIFTTEELEEFQSEFNNRGVTGCVSYFEKINEQWKTIPLKVGVIGSTGVGKSSFINAMRGLRSSALGAAPVDVIETTVTPTEYSHPNNAMLKFWDLPGVGTPKFPKDSYLAQIEVDSYDCFVILTSNRFTETDAWLAKQIYIRRKQFYFVRSKIGHDILSDRFENGSNHKEVDVVEKIRQHSIEHLKLLGVSDWVFLIDNHQRSKYDFDELEQTIIENLPDLKRQAMILSLSAFTASMIAIKVAELRKRGWYVAISSAIVAAVPIPGVSVAFDAVILTRELKFYYQQLGLDDDSLKQRAQLMSVDYGSLKEVVRQEFPQAVGIQLFKSLAQVGGYAVGVVFEEASRYIPFIGSLVTAPMSLAFTKFALNYMLDKMEKTSLELTKYFPKKGSDGEPLPVCKCEPTY